MLRDKLTSPNVFNWQFLYQIESIM